MRILILQVTTLLTFSHLWIYPSIGRRVRSCTPASSATRPPTGSTTSPLTLPGSTAHRMVSAAIFAKKFSRMCQPCKLISRKKFASKTLFLENETNQNMNINIFHDVIWNISVAFVFEEKISITNLRFISFFQFKWSSANLSVK